MLSFSDRPCDQASNDPDPAQAAERIERIAQRPEAADRRF